LRHERGGLGQPPNIHEGRRVGVGPGLLQTGPVEAGQILRCRHSRSRPDGRAAAENERRKPKDKETSRIHGGGQYNK